MMQFTFALLALVAFANLWGEENKSGSDGFQKPDSELSTILKSLRSGRPDSDRRLLAQLGEESKSGNDRFHMGPHDNRQYSIEAPFNRGGDNVRRRVGNTDLFQQTRSHSGT